MRHYIYVLLLSLIPMLAKAQGENDNWYFGDHAGLNFASPNPVALTNSQMLAYEACGTVSDSSGNLLFYTNGQNIWNRQHQVMQNGNMIGGSLSSQQIAIVKNPQNPNQYFVFTGGDYYFHIDSAFHYTLSYSIVDMSLGPLVGGQPLGAVMPGFKGIHVLDNLGNKFASEAITIVPAAVDGSYWLLIPNGTKLYSYRINSSGFQNGNPVISNLNLPYVLGYKDYYGIKASPALNNGSFSHYLCMSLYSLISPPYFLNKVYSFNNTTGQITSDYTMEINSMRAYSPEFNKDASVLFMGHAKIFAIDMITSTSSSVNFMEIYDGSSFFPNFEDAVNIQRNKYNDIYICKAQKSYLGKVINPDVYGPAMTVDIDFADLGGKLTYYGLPPLVYTAGPQCIPDILLTTPETHSQHTYQASNTITTKDRYTVFPQQDIRMKAGRYVSMLPNTYVMKGATFLANIETCGDGERQNIAPKESRQSVRIVLDLDQASAQGEDMRVYPNPASTMATIDIKKEKLLSWELYDMSGKVVSKGNSSSINVEGLAEGIYLLRAVTASGKNRSKKFVVQ